MTRKDYVLIAEAIRTLPEFSKTVVNFTAEQRREVAEHFAHALRGTNPAFSPSRFIAAATLPTLGRDVAPAQPESCDYPGCALHTWHLGWHRSEDGFALAS